MRQKIKLVKISFFNYTSLTLFHACRHTNIFFLSLVTFGKNVYSPLLGNHPPILWNSPSTSSLPCSTNILTFYFICNFFFQLSPLYHLNKHITCKSPFSQEWSSISLTLHSHFVERGVYILHVYVFTSIYICICIYVYLYTYTFIHMKRTNLWKIKYCWSILHTYTIITCGGLSGKHPAIDNIMRMICVELI